MKQYSTTAIEMKYSYSSVHFYTHTRTHETVLNYSYRDEVLILEYTFLYSYSSTHFYTRIRTHETVLNYSYRDEALVLECTFLYSYS